MVFIKAYVGGLYLPQDIPASEVLSEVSKRLEVEGSEFAAAIFSVWPGPNPIDRSLKKQLLGL